ncbi:MAG: ECF transporter S component [Clostridiales bacterium]|uniref:ECF transporter S component n=1 Tax=Clostridium sp. N3C TaxID=1776758 RepID=UPI00092DFB62|nr:ECF transporter S component [Clostridium sp. N3C]NLZ47888.1 ECF transporter S component [Clostridiales bacterium]SCN23239.1 putative membrane protein [Clostridium sp. N3C]
MSDNNVSNHVSNMVITSLMAAIVFVATYSIKINTFGGYVHLGDSMVLLSALLLGKKKGAVASAMGMGLADILYMPIWAPFTIVIKAVMAIIAASIAFRKDYEGEKVWNNALGFIVAGLWMTAAYFVAGAFVASLILGRQPNLAAGFAAALKDVPGNLWQASAGIIIALPVGSMLMKVGLPTLINKKGTNS